MALAGIIDLVPAYSSLLVSFDPGETDEAQLRQALATETPGKEALEPGRLHTIPVSYGGAYGPDLEDVAQHLGLDRGKIVDLHSSCDYHVYFVGFMPGFGYLGLTPSALDVPRLPSPRTRVPAGSVAVAGRQSGVYPFDSPGGWRILGRTPVSLWDPQRESPSLLSPGDSVRFVPSEWRAPKAAIPRPRSQLANPIFEVIEPGAFTTVQDLGRPGYGSVGLSAGGAMDAAATIRANALVGNRPQAALLEMTWTGPTLRALRTTVIAHTGADLHCFVDGSRVPGGVSWLVRAGSTLRFNRAGPESLSGRAFLAIAGGLDVEEVLGSRSTYMPASFGGLEGRSLRAGDVLGVVEPSADVVSLAGRERRGEAGTTSPTKLRFVTYDGPQGVGQDAGERFEQESWLVDARSDRVGTRLQPAAVPARPTGLREQTSFGVVRGAIQLPPDGNPVMLNVDHQTTGGYPVIGAVCEADWSLLARLVPGDEVRFERVSLEEARAELARIRADLRAGVWRLASPGL